MILFFEFSGLLHPSSVYVHSGRLPLQGEGELFSRSQVFSDFIAGQPGVRLVFSTNWCRIHGYKRTLTALPERMRERVIGSTYHSKLTEGYDNTTRYRQISGFIGQSRIAIDDLHEGDELNDGLAADSHRPIRSYLARSLFDPKTACALRAKCCTGGRLRIVQYILIKLQRACRQAVTMRAKLCAGCGEVAHLRDLDGNLLVLREHHYAERCCKRVST